MLYQLGFGRQGLVYDTTYIFKVPHTFYAPDNKIAYAAVNMLVCKVGGFTTLWEYPWHWGPLTISYRLNGKPMCIPNRMIGRCPYANADDTRIYWPKSDRLKHSIPYHNGANSIVRWRQSAGIPEISENHVVSRAKSARWFVRNSDEIRQAIESFAPGNFDDRELMDEIMSMGKSVSNVRFSEYTSIYMRDNCRYDITDRDDDHKASYSLWGKARDICKRFSHTLLNAGRLVENSRPKVVRKKRRRKRRIAIV